VYFRASIEEDYSKRLAKLAKMSLGRDEIGYVLNIIFAFHVLGGMQAMCMNLIDLDAPPQATIYKSLIS
jgi:hypothetical protein